MKIKLMAIALLLIAAMFIKIIVIQNPIVINTVISMKNIPTNRNKPVVTSFQSKKKPNYLMSNELEYKLNMTNQCARSLSVGQMNPHPIDRWNDPKLWRYSGQVIDKGKSLLNDALRPFDKLNYVAGLRGIIILCDNGNFDLVVVNIQLLIHMGWKDIIQIYHYNELKSENVDLLQSFPKVTVRDLKEYTINGLPIPYEQGKRWDPVVNGAYARNYHLKPVAIIVSELHHILFMDGDAFPLYSPVDLFQTNEYKLTGLLQWMDIWKPNPSNPMFEIFKGRIDCFWDWELEAGQVLIDKEKHENTIQLMLRLMLDRFWVSFVFWGDK